MNPWNILGWLLVIIVAIPVAFIMLGLIAGFFKLFKGSFDKWLKYYLTRKVKPQEGQLWQQGDSLLRIGRVHDDGSFTIRSGNASWNETPENWKKRVKNRKLYLISQPKKD
jgi:hypothetical protein